MRQSGVKCTTLITTARLWTNISTRRTRYTDTPRESPFVRPTDDNYDAMSIFKLKTIDGGQHIMSGLKRLEYNLYRLSKISVLQIFYEILARLYKDFVTINKFRF